MQTKNSLLSTINYYAGSVDNQNSGRTQSAARRTWGVSLKGGLLTAIACIVLACGGEDNDSAGNNGTTCGPGTVEINGQCVPGGQCGEGTQSEGGQCVANGGSGGASGSAGASGSSASGGSNSGGTAGSSGNAGTSGQSGTGGAGGSNTGGASGSGGAAGNPLDAPCPEVTTEAVLNCSHTCGDYDSRCDQVTCHPYDESFTPVYFDEFNYQGFIRTPSSPGVDPLCADGCGGGMGNAVYGIAIQLTHDSQDSYDIRVTVDPPWYVTEGGGQAFGFDAAGNFCIGDTLFPDGRNCIVMNSLSLVTVVTNDPNAPSANVLIERGFPLTCD